MSKKYDLMLRMALLEARLNELKEAPERPLKPGQTARITGKDSKEIVAKIKNYIFQHKHDLNKIDQLERRINSKEIYGLTPEDVVDLQRQIDNLKKSRDPKVQNYDKIISQIVPIIKTRCSKYLPSLKVSRFFLYRGMSISEHKNRLAFRAHSRDARYPSDSEELAQIKFDKVLTELGMTALRHNSIFTSSDHNLSRMYGTEYIIFPTNEATYTWSKYRGDLILKMDELKKYRELDPNVVMARSMVLERMNELEKSEEISRNATMMRYFRNFRSYLKTETDINPRYLKDEIDNALNRFSRKEFDSELLAALEDLIRHANIEKDNLDVNRFNIDLDRFQKAFAMSNKGFDEALSSGNEILINGEYIAVLGSFEELLREALNAN